MNGRRPADTIAAFVRLLIEVEAGARPARHLRPLLAADLQHRLRMRPPLEAVAGEPVPRVGRVIVQVTGRSCEAVAVVHGPRRTTALAVSLRRAAEGWRVTEVARPGAPDPLPAPGRSDQDPVPPPPDDALSEPSAPAIPTWSVPAGWISGGPEAA